MSFSCASKKNATEAITISTNAFNVSDSTIIAKLKTTGCFGRCPTYELIVFANGDCNFEAKKWTELEIGMYTSKIDVSIVNNLHLIGDTIGFKSYDSIYTNPYIQDKPSVYLSLYITEQDSLKTVERIIDYPREILDLEKALKKIVTNSNWKKANNLTK